MTNETISGWFAGRVHDDWFTEAPEVRIDRDEILVTCRLAEPKTDASAGDDAVRAARHARIEAFREDTRQQRMQVAADAERRFERKVSWAVRCGDTEVRFTTASVPVMTRLRMDERAILDTLIDGGVARSRSEALAWCVKLVGAHEGDWIDELRDAAAGVAEVRDRGPA